jgi:hypothetical protein
MNLPRLRRILASEGFRLSKTAECLRTYDGPPLESGGTSIKGRGEAPAIRRLMGKVIQPGMTVLDYGAGKYSRNADFIRASGARVYAFDPFNGVGSDGWEMGEVAMSLPPAGVKFDVGFTSFVLNVVPEYIEDKIIREVNQRSAKSIHITRNEDIFVMVSGALARGEKFVTSFFRDWFAPGDPIAQAELESGEFTEETVRRFCCYGVQTSRGFQRIPQLEHKGFSLSGTKSFNIYIK